jgi:diguanylate cyclase (GGDEF)-like protein
MTDLLPPFDSPLASIREARILIVDDEPLQCAQLARGVEEWGAVPFVAQTFADALRLHRDVAPDIVLLDVVMPQVDGFKVAARFKREARFVPIILLTGLDDIESKRRALIAGADECLTKPVNLVELQIRVSSMLRIKRLADQLEAANVRLSALATVDPLTQLVNRRVLTERMTLEFTRAKRYRNPFSCLLIDIDHFKNVNDTRGHTVGDMVLAAVAGSLAGTIRDTDLVGRYGGEEFMILAPETSLRQAMLLGERLRCGVESQVTSEVDFPAVTISIGIAGTEQAVESTTDLVALADEALYRAKREGRNRVVGAT